MLFRSFSLFSDLLSCQTMVSTLVLGFLVSGSLAANPIRCDCGDGVCESSGLPVMANPFQCIEPGGTSCCACCPEGQVPCADQFFNPWCADSCEPSAAPPKAQTCWPKDTSGCSSWACQSDQDCYATLPSKYHCSTGAQCVNNVCQDSRVVV